MEFGFAFALGMLGSLHCVAMCGPLMIALPAPAGGAMRLFTGRTLYQLGRVMTYGLLGVLAGLFGRSLFLIGLQRWLSILLGVAVLAGFLLSKRVALSAPVVKLVTRLKQAMSRQFQQRNVRSHLLLGMLNGLLPCGLVYGALAGSVVTGTVGRSIGYMLFFGLGTLLPMLSLSLGGQAIPASWRWQLRKLIPFGVCALATLLILRGMALGIPYLSPNLAAEAAGCCAH
jgi:sulfite exporter TauE/SafE